MSKIPPQLVEPLGVGGELRGQLGEISHGFCEAVRETRAALPRSGGRLGSAAAQAMKLAAAARVLHALRRQKTRLPSARTSFSAS